MHHLDNWVKRDQLDVTCFIISLFNAQHVSDVNTAILRSLRFICWVISWVVLLWLDVCWCYVVVWLWWSGIRMQAEAQINRKLQRMDVLTSETCWTLYKEIIKQVTSSWSLFTELCNCLFHEGPPRGKDTDPHQSRNCYQRCHIRRKTREADGITRRFINITTFL